MLESSSTNGYRRKRPQKVELQGGTQIREGRKTLKCPNNNSVKNTLKDEIKEYRSTFIGIICIVKVTATTKPTGEQKFSAS